MRVGGQSILAILAAAVAIYLLGFLIYGLVFSEMWQGFHGYTKESMETLFAGKEWRMALSPVMPLLIAFGMAKVIGWRGQKGLVPGVRTGLVVGVCFLIASRMYGFVYGPEPEGLLIMDSLHMLAGALIAGAVIGAWPERKAA
ncbi:MAG: DUF1761 domain-containing protein [Alphaproteobacteria bacterium]|nr:DUF1761 domain-containing protein [Alphaproteobacteria bacterium]